ncbi:hypothetical protein [Lactobacillus xylocopicola]|uniref:Uncharacterized protein n=1 Tax=Lactobacillus xylocopicola TaxID=2976676 RepID=A0ABN6SJS8_9LACO|nr:hypothetical protein [Lactobacillus xylocopicola]BDR60409.1 hypothetical protein KIM322_06700 [Lactobacillus xylocopicola]
MTEKRSDYRKKIKHKKSKTFFTTIKSAFDSGAENVDVNPEFTRSTADKQQVDDHETPVDQPRLRSTDEQTQVEEDKGRKLKQKLNRAILLVLVLLILVLIALFHL